MEDTLFESTAKLNDYDTYALSDLRRQRRGNNEGFSKDWYVALLSSTIADKLRVDPDKVAVFKKLSMKTLKTIFWDRLSGIKDTDVTVGSPVVWCKDDDDFFKGVVTKRFKDEETGLVDCYGVKYTDGDYEELSLEHLKRKLHIQFGSEDIPPSEEST